MQLDDLLRLAMAATCVVCYNDTEIEDDRVIVTQQAFTDGECYTFRIGDLRYYVDLGDRGFMLTHPSGAIYEFSFYPNSRCGTLIAINDDAPTRVGEKFRLELTSKANVVVTTEPNQYGGIDIICLRLATYTAASTVVGTVEACTIYPDDSCIQDRRLLGYATPYLFMLAPWAIQMESDPLDDTLIISDIIGLQNKHSAYVIAGFRGERISYHIKRSCDGQQCHITAVTAKGVADYVMEKHESDHIALSGQLGDIVLDGLVKITNRKSVPLVGNAPKLHWIRSATNICGMIEAF